MKRERDMEREIESGRDIMAMRQRHGKSNTERDNERECVVMTEIVYQLLWSVSGVTS